MRVYKRDKILASKYSSIGISIMDLIAFNISGISAPTSCLSTKKERSPDDILRIANAVNIVRGGLHRTINTLNTGDGRSYDRAVPMMTAKRCRKAEGRSKKYSEKK